MTYKDQIKNRINAFTSDDVFIANDFFDIAGYETARNALNRLVRAKEISRVIEGYYCKARYDEFGRKSENPPANEVAKAIGRKNRCKVVPYGNAATYLLGLIDSKPAKWTYVTNGKEARYDLEDAVIILRRKSMRDISKMSSVAATVIQAIKELGKGNITESQVEYLKSTLELNVKEELLRYDKSLNPWIYEVLERICN